MAEAVPPLGDSPSKPITYEEKLLQARVYKQQGNEHFKSKDYRKAMGQYHRGLLYLRGLLETNRGQVFPGLPAPDPLPKEIMTEVVSLQINCYNNLAACLLQVAEPNLNKVVQYCRDVLDLSPKNVKAMYRMGVAYHRLKDYDRALEILSSAQKLPEGASDSNIKRLVTTCQQEVAKQDKKLKDKYKGMFDKMAKEETPT